MVPARTISGTVLNICAMKIVGHTNYKTAANIYAQVVDKRLRKATVNMGDVFGSRGQAQRFPGRCPAFFVFGIVEREGMWYDIIK